MKFITLLLALAVTSGSVYAQDEEDLRPDHRAFDRMEKRIDAALAGDISERRRAFLLHRRAFLSLQADIREALRAALAALDEEATDQQRKDARDAVRGTFAEDLEAIKEARRGTARERRRNRGDDADG